MANGVNTGGRPTFAARGRTLPELPSLQAPLPTLTLDAKPKAKPKRRNPQAAPVSHRAVETKAIPRSGR